jgi:hypothetical protein
MPAVALDAALLADSSTTLGAVVAWSLAAAPSAGSSLTAASPPVQRTLLESITTNSFISASLAAAVPDDWTVIADSNATGTLKVSKLLGLDIASDSAFGVGWMTVLRRKVPRVPIPPVPTLRRVPQPPPIPRLTVNTRRRPTEG